MPTDQAIDTTGASPHIRALALDALRGGRFRSLLFRNTVAQMYTIRCA
jgi:hypothetical protein